MRESNISKILSQIQTSNLQERVGYDMSGILKDTLQCLQSFSSLILDLETLEYE